MGETWVQVGCSQDKDLSSKMDLAIDSIISHSFAEKCHGAAAAAAAAV